MPSTPLHTSIATALNDKDTATSCEGSETLANGKLSLTANITTLCNIAGSTKIADWLRASKAYSEGAVCYSQFHLSKTERKYYNIIASARTAR